MEEKVISCESTDLVTTDGDNEHMNATQSRRRGRPTAQRSVHELVLNLKNVNKKHKTLKSIETQIQKSLTTDADNDDMNATTVTSEAVMSGSASEKWTIGQRVEARDVVGDWYSAKIVNISDESSRVLVHFERWSSRYDQWFDFNSLLIREKTETTEDNGSAADSCLSFALNEEVLAKWNDNKSYPASIVHIYEEQRAVLVLFYDGYRKKVKMTSIEKMPQNFEGMRVPFNKKKNQMFQIKDDHNDYKCTKGCNKGFRKQSLLSQHLKHYHKSDDRKTSSELSVVTTTATTATPTTTPPQPPSPPSPSPCVPIFKCSPTTTATPSQPNSETKSRLKRKYVRKPLPMVAVRKSNRQQQHIVPIGPNAQEVLPMTPNTTPMTTTASLVTPVVKESPTVTPNTTLPFWDARTIAEIHENDDIDELVHCVCAAREESGLMVQCELCLCWQHAMCMNFKSETEIPKTGYFCLSCRFPKHVRKSRRTCLPVYYNTSSPVWRPFSPKVLNNEFSRDTNSANNSEEKTKESEEKELLVATHALLSAALDSKEVLTSLNTKCHSKHENEIIEKQNEIYVNLAKIEEKVVLLERELNELFPSFDSKEEINCSEIKSEIYLLFKDLKNAKTFCEFI